MNDTLWAIYIGVLCLVALLAAIWLVIEVIVRKRKERLVKGVYELDGRLYKLVPYEQEEEARESKSETETVPCSEQEAAPEQQPCPECVPEPQPASKNLNRTLGLGSFSLFFSAFIIAYNVVKPPISACSRLY